MGYINHHAIVVTTGSKEAIDSAHAKAFEIFGSLCSEIIDSGMNGYATFFIAPDGSKEGWQDSDEGDERRTEFKNWLKVDRHYSIEAVEIYYGGDESDLKGIEEI